MYKALYKPLSPDARAYSGNMSLSASIVDRLVTEGADFDFGAFLGVIPRTLVDRLNKEQHRRKCRMYEVWGTICVGKGDAGEKLFVCRQCASKAQRRPSRMPHRNVIVYIRKKLYEGHDVLYMIKSTCPEKAFKRWECALCCRSCVELWNPRSACSKYVLQVSKRVDFDCCDTQPKARKGLDFLFPFSDHLFSMQYF